MVLNRSRRTLIAGTWLNCGLYSLELAQAYIYFRTYRQDPAWTRYLVWFVLFCDTLGSLSSCALVYLVCQSTDEVPRAAKLTLPAVLRAILG